MIQSIQDIPERLSALKGKGIGMRGILALILFEISFGVVGCQAAAQKAENKSLFSIKDVNIKRIVLVIDISRSMRSNDREFLRVDSCHVLRELLPAKMQLGVVSFSTDAQTVFDLETSRDEAHNAVEKDLRRADGMTNFCSALKEASDLLGDDPGYIVFMTDGRRTAGCGWKRIFELVDELVNKGTRIYCISFTEQAEVPKFQEMARRGRGAYYHPKNAEELFGTFQLIATSIFNYVWKEQPGKVMLFPGTRAWWLGVRDGDLTRPSIANIRYNGGPVGDFAKWPPEQVNIKSHFDIWSIQNPRPGSYEAVPTENGKIACVIVRPRFEWGFAYGDKEPDERYPSSPANVALRLKVEGEEQVLRALNGKSQMFSTIECLDNHAIVAERRALDQEPWAGKGPLYFTGRRSVENPLTERKIANFQVIVEYQFTPSQWKLGERRRVFAVSPRPEPRLLIRSETLDFGDALDEAVATLRVELRGAQKAQLHIAKIQPKYDGLSLEIQDAAISQGAHNLTFKLKNAHFLPRGRYDNIKLHLGAKTISRQREQISVEGSPVTVKFRRFGEIYLPETVNMKDMEVFSKETTGELEIESVFADGVTLLFTPRPPNRTGAVQIIPARITVNVGKGKENYQLRLMAGECAAGKHSVPVAVRVQEGDANYVELKPGAEFTITFTAKPEEWSCIFDKPDADAHPGEPIPIEARIIFNDQDISVADAKKANIRVMVEKGDGREFTPVGKPITLDLDKDRKVFSNTITLEASGHYRVRSSTLVRGLPRVHITEGEVEFEVVQREFPFALIGLTAVIPQGGTVAGEEARIPLSIVGVTEDGEERTLTLNSIYGQMWQLTNVQWTASYTNAQGQQRDIIVQGRNGGFVALFKPPTGGHYRLYFGASCTFAPRAGKQRAKTVEKKAETIIEINASEEWRVVDNIQRDEEVQVEPENGIAFDFSIENDKSGAEILANSLGKTTMELIIKRIQGRQKIMKRVELTRKNRTFRATVLLPPGQYSAKTVTARVPDYVAQVDEREIKFVVESLPNPPQLQGTLTVQVDNRNVTLRSSVTYNNQVVQVGNALDDTHWVVSRAEFNITTADHNGDQAQYNSIAPWGQQAERATFEQTIEDAPLGRFTATGTMTVALTFVRDNRALGQTKMTLNLARQTAIVFPSRNDFRVVLEGFTDNQALQAARRIAIYQDRGIPNLQGQRGRWVAKIMYGQQQVLPGTQVGPFSVRAEGNWQWTFTITRKGQRFPAELRHPEGHKSVWAWYWDRGLPGGSYILGVEAPRFRLALDGEESGLYNLTRQFGLTVVGGDE